MQDAAKVVGIAIRTCKKVVLKNTVLPQTVEASNRVPRDASPLVHDLTQVHPKGTPEATATVTAGAPIQLGK